MTAERCSSRDQSERKRDQHFRARRSDWRRWLESGEAFDPDRWKAMASAWKSVWQDGGDGAMAEHQTPTTTKTCPYCAEEVKPAAIKCKHCGTWLATPPDPISQGCASTMDDFDPTLVRDYAPARRITRSSADAMVYGVFSGLGRFLGVDPTWLRIAFALGSLFTALLPGVVVYLILTVLIPSDAQVKDHGIE